MKRTTTVMVAMPAAAILVASGVGIASALDQPRPTTTRPVSSTVHDPAPATVTRTPSGRVSVRHTSTPQQATAVRQTQTVRAPATPRATSTTPAVTQQPMRSYTHSDDCDRDRHVSGDHDGYDGMHDGDGMHR